MNAYSVTYLPRSWSKEKESKVVVAASVETAAKAMKQGRYNTNQVTDVALLFTNVKVA